MPSLFFFALLQLRISTWNLRAHSFWAWLLIGLIAGWLAGFAFRGQGFGCITDILLGLVGSVIGGWLFNYFGIMGGEFYISLAAAAVGAMVLVGLARLFHSGAKP